MESVKLSTGQKVKIVQARTDQGMYVNITTEMAGKQSTFSLNEKDSKSLTGKTLNAATLAPFIEKFYNKPAKAAKAK